MTLTAVPTHTTDTDPAATARVLPELVELDPAHVAQHPDNLRDPGRELKALTASVAEVGLLVPLIVVPIDAVPGEHVWPAGTTHVAVDGNRRQAAAAAAGLPLPCVIRPDLGAARAAARTMAVTGLVRDGLTAAEEARAVAVLFQTGMSQTAIGRALGRTREQVKTAKKAATLTEQSATEADYPLTLDQMAVLAEWQDTPGALDQLTAAIGRGRLDHAVAQLRQQAAEDAVIDAARVQLAAAGVTVTDAEPSRWGPGPARPLSQLRTDAAAPMGQRIEVAGHGDCPGDAVWIGVTDEPEPTDTDDDEADDNETDLYPEDDGEGAPGPLRAVLIPLCSDPEHYGHAPVWRDCTRSAGPGGPVPIRPAVPREGESEQEAADRVAAEWEAAADAAAETQRQQRRDLISRSKQADAAETVRREFLRQALTVKSRSKQMAAWALARVVSGDWTYLRSADNLMRSAVLGQILDGDPGTVIAAAPATRHGVILWAHVAAAYEQDYPRDCHRYPDAARAAYLTHLHELGYPLSDIEQHIIDAAAPAKPEPETAEPEPSDETAEPERVVGEEPAGRVSVAETAA